MISRLASFKSYFQRGLAARLLIAIVLFSSLITLIITATQLFFDYRHDVFQIESRLQQIENVHLESIENALWALDEEYARILVEGILQMPDMIYLEIRDGNKTWLSAGLVQEGQVIDQEFALFDPTADQPVTPLGTFRAVASLDQVYQRLFERAITLVGSNAIKTFLVAGFILFVVHLLVTRHLRDVSRFVVEQGIENPEPLRLEREKKAGSRSDELDQLVDGLNSMRDDLRKSFAQLKKAEKEREMLVEELQAKNKRLEHFADTVSHELKTPLVTISGFTGMLRRDIENGDDSRLDDSFKKIEGATATMSSLLEDLLKVSRVGHLDQTREAVELSELAQEATQFLDFVKDRPRFEVEIAPGLPQIHANRAQILQVMQNLVENAAKFCGQQDNPRISIGADHEDGQVTCFVRDNGNGIEPEYQQRIFKLFERLDQNIEGTGVGLALASGIVETHGGKIWVESEGAGKGSTFFFSLPQRSTDLQNQPNP